MKRLSDILDATYPSEMDVSISGLTLDSRQLQPGEVFIALQGEKDHGQNFIPIAIEKNAAAILVEDSHHYQQMIQAKQKTIPLIGIPKLRQKLSDIAAKFYDHPTQDMTLIGITGTNGKTSVSHFIAQSLQHLGITCGIIGTVGYGLHSPLHPLNNTTPDAITLQKIFYELKKMGATHVAMEVSSHALAQFRMGLIPLKFGVFTNISHEHLDYHHTLEEYAAAKEQLFKFPTMKYAVLNLDDPVGLIWASRLSTRLKVFGFALNEHPIDIPKLQAKHLQFTDLGIHATLHTPWGKGLLHTPIVGRFNIYNVLATASVLGILNIPLPSALNALNQLKPVTGRMEYLGGGGQPLVIIDYAHTPDALEKVLQTLKEQCKGELWCIFGCGGDRDRSKRPKMGAIAEQYADAVVVTDDNPRTEDPKQIVHEILAGMSNPKKSVIEHERARAIAHAISCAQPDDIVLIAGKGHETYQIGMKTYPFSDIMEAKLALENRIENL